MARVFLLILIFFSLNLYAQDTTEVYEEENMDYSDEEEESEEGEVKDTTMNLKGKKEGGFKYKAPSKFKLLFEHFHFNAATGVGVTRWRSNRFGYEYYTGLKYKGTGLNVPLHALILYDFKKFRIGVGGSFEFYFMKYLRPSDNKDTVPSYEFPGITTFKKFYVHTGIPYFVNKEYSYLANLEVGMYKVGQSYTSAHGFRPYVNLGITMERKLSEYFRLYLKPTVEYKSFPLKVPGSYTTINQKLLTFYLLAGVSYSIPMFPKCPIKPCGVRVRHYHQNKLFRGNPFYRLQNPNYGEENKRLFKYKGKNKKKLEPY